MAWAVASWKRCSPATMTLPKKEQPFESADGDGECNRAHAADLPDDVLWA